MKYANIYLGVLTTLLLASCKHNETKTTENKAQAIAVNVTKVESSQANKEVSVSGNVDGSTTVRLGFLVAGRINFISSREGQNIGKGQLVATIEPTNYKIAKDLSDVQVNQVSDEYNRLKLMRDRNSISESDFSKVNFTLQQAKLQQQLQQKNLTDTKLYSPISGVLIKKLGEVGEIIGTGNPLLVISDIRKVKVLAYIPEGELHLIKLGQMAEVTISALDKTFKGRVTEVGSAADATSRAFTIKIEVDNPGLLIRPGMIAEARIKTNVAAQRILLPLEIINHDLDNQEFVYVVDQAQNKAFKRKISIGKVADNQVEVVSGLNVGEVVVSAGQNKLSDGSLITIK